MPVLTTCPDCGHFQVSVLPAERGLRLKCVQCRVVYPPAWEEDWPEMDAAQLALATTVIGSVREPKRRLPRDLVVRNDLPADYPPRPKRRRSTQLRKRLSEAAAANLLAIPVEPERNDTSEPAAVSTIAPLTPAPPTTGLASAPARQPAIPIRPIRAKRRKTQSDSADVDEAVVFAWIGIMCLGVGLLILQIPYGRMVAIGFAAVGLWFGIRAVRRAHRRVAWAATLGNPLLILSLLVLPSWFGHPSWQSPKQEQDLAPQVRQLTGESADLGAGYVDVTKSYWEMDEVRVTSAAPRIGKAKLFGPTGGSRMTGRDYLCVRVHINNRNPVRHITVPDWQGATPANIKLMDAQSLPLTLASFGPQESPLPPGIEPLRMGKTIDLFLYFDAPAGMSSEYKLELPAEALGLTGTIRLRLPGSDVKRKR